MLLLDYEKKISPMLSYLSFIEMNYHRPLNFFCIAQGILPACVCAGGFGVRAE